jgi:hypothetical protein
MSDADQDVTRDPATDDVLSRAATRQGVTVEQLQQRLREVEAQHKADPTLCDWCEAKLPDPSERRGQKTARYCPGPNCRKAAARARQREARDQAKP